MANVMDYLDWRGDLSFAVSPFNEVDNYICSVSGNPDFGGIVPEDGNMVFLPEVMAAYDERYGADSERLGVLMSPHTLPMLRALAVTPRFERTAMGGYTSQLDVERAEQFSALTLALPDGSFYVAYRGTDDTIAGWKEDFLMGVQEVVPAQTYALEYLCWAAETFRGPLRVGGHSKGGNLAVYAAIHAPRAVQERILAVYSNDGPGFHENVEETEGFRFLRERIHTILPQHSMVGQLLCRAGEPVIVESSVPGMWAHDGFRWQVLGTRFVRCEDFSRGSKAFREAMDEVVDGMAIDEREAFVDELFDALTSTGAVTLTDLTEHKLSQVAALFREGRRSPRVQKVLGSILGQTVREYADGVWDILPENLLPWRRKDAAKTEESESEAPQDGGERQ